MLRELVELGRHLRAEGKLPPPGFADYAAPIRWTLTLRPPEKIDGAPLVTLRETEVDRPRPDSGRTSGVLAYPLVDTAAYVLGVEVKEDEKTDANAKKKHRAFLERLDEVEAAVEAEELIAAIKLLRGALQEQLPHQESNFGEVRADHWVSVEMGSGPLAGIHLFEHEEVKRYWADWLDSQVSQEGATGTCSITGEERPLVDRVPGKGYFRGKASLLGLNEDAYVSYVGGAGASKRASLGVSYDAADVANRALAYLARSDQHRRTLAYDKNSDLRTLTALFWLSAEISFEVQATEGTMEVTREELEALLGQVIDDGPVGGEKPERDLAQVRNLLAAPWVPQRSSLTLDEAGFYLAVLSKNVYRVVVREWRAQDLGTVKGHLSTFLDAASIVAPAGDVRPVSIREMLTATYGIVDDQGKQRSASTKSANHARDLLRAAYFGLALSDTLLPPVLARLRTLLVKEADPQRPFREHKLLSLLKLILTHQTPAAMSLQHLDSERNEQAYLCGCLLAVLGRIQQDALTDDNVKGKKTASLNRTVTERYFAAASAAPGSYLAPLVQRATVAHIPRLPRESEKNSYRKTQIWADRKLTELLACIHEQGGFPHILDLRGQGEFALGYYHQRANFFSKSESTSSNTSSSNPSDDA